MQMEVWSLIVRWWQEAVSAVKVYWSVNFLDPRKYNTSKEANNSPDIKEIPSVSSKIITFRKSSLISFIPYQIIPVQDFTYNLFKINFDIIL